MEVNIHTHSPKAEELTLRTTGIHPYDTEDVTPDTLLSIERTAIAVDAIGEIGLDFACSADREAQRLAFVAQLDIAQHYGKGVVLHCVRAFEPMMNILKGYTLPYIIFHGFIGSTEQALRATNRGYYLSFGERTFRSPKTIEAMQSIPTDRLFLETDQSQTPIGEIYDRAAATLGLPRPILESIISENFNRICG
ncbi:MAG: TatD family hydrolase [Alistipes sp.]|nr:TatD family hydrolase [Alistipes sp.]